MGKGKCGEYVLWNGILCVKGVYACPAQLTSSIRIGQPGELGKCLNLKWQAKTSETLESYLKMIPAAGMMQTGEIFSKSWYFNICSLKPLDSKERFSKIQNHLCKTDAISIVKSGEDILLIMADTKLTQCLGVNQDGESLHCVILSKHSKLIRGKGTPPYSPKQTSLPFLEVRPASSVLTVKTLRETLHFCNEQKKSLTSSVSASGRTNIEGRRGLHDEKRAAQSGEGHPERKRHKSEHSTSVSVGEDETDALTLGNLDNLVQRKRHKSETSSKTDPRKSPAVYSTSVSVSEDKTNELAVANLNNLVQQKRHKSEMSRKIYPRKSPAIPSAFKKPDDGINWFDRVFSDNKQETNKKRTTDQFESETHSLKKSKTVADSQSENTHRDLKSSKKSSKTKAFKVSVLEKKQMESEKVFSQLNLCHSKANVQSLGRIPKKKPKKSNEENCCSIREAESNVSSNNEDNKGNKDLSTPKDKHSKEKTNDDKSDKDRKHKKLKGSPKKKTPAKDNQVSHKKEVKVPEKSHMVMADRVNETEVDNDVIQVSHSNNSIIDSSHNICEPELNYERDATDDLDLLEKTSQSDVDLSSMLQDRDLQSGRVRCHTSVRKDSEGIPGLGDLDKLRDLEHQESKGKVGRKMRKTDDGLLVMISNANLGLENQNNAIVLDDFIIQSIHGMSKTGVSSRLKVCSFCEDVYQALLMETTSNNTRATTVDITNPYSLKTTIHFPDDIERKNIPNKSAPASDKINESNDMHNDVLCTEGPLTEMYAEKVSDLSKLPELCTHTSPDIDDSQRSDISRDHKELIKAYRNTSKLDNVSDRLNKIVSGEQSADWSYTIKEERGGTPDLCITSQVEPLQERDKVDHGYRVSECTQSKQTHGVDHREQSSYSQGSEMPMVIGTVKEMDCVKNDVSQKTATVKKCTSSTIKQNSQSVAKACSPDKDSQVVEEEVASSQKEQSAITISSNIISQGMESGGNVPDRNVGQESQIVTVRSKPSSLRQEEATTVRAKLTRIESSERELGTNQSDKQRLEDRQSVGNRQSSGKPTQKSVTNRAVDDTRRVVKLEGQDKVSSGCELSQRRINTPKLGNLQTRLEKIAEMPVPKEMQTKKSEKNEKSEKSEKRQARQFHPYKKDPKPKPPDKPTWSFDIAYSDMEELLQNLTENMFMVDGRTPADVRKWRKGFSRSSLGRVRGRFCGHRFRRSEVPRNLPNATETREDEDEYEIDPELISNMEERARQADMVEETWHDKSHEETVFIEEMCIYNQEKEQDVSMDTSAHIKTLKSTTTLTIPGMGKTSTFSAEQLGDMDSSSEELFQDNNLHREQTPTVDVVTNKEIASTVDVKTSKEIANTVDVKTSKEKASTVSMVTSKGRASTNSTAARKEKVNSVDVVTSNKKANCALSKDSKVVTKTMCIPKSSAETCKPPNVASKNQALSSIPNILTPGKEKNVNIQSENSQDKKSLNHIKTEKSTIKETTLDEEIEDQLHMASFEAGTDISNIASIENEDQTEEEERFKKPGLLSTSRLGEQRILSSDSDVCLDWSDDEVSERGGEDSDSDIDDKTFVVIDTVEDHEVDYNEAITCLSNGQPKPVVKDNPRDIDNYDENKCTSVLNTSLLSHSDGNESASEYNSDMYSTVDEVTDLDLTHTDKQELKLCESALKIHTAGRSVLQPPTAQEISTNTLDLDYDSLSGTNKSTSLMTEIKTEKLKDSLCDNVTTVDNDSQMGCKSNGNYLMNQTDNINKGYVTESPKDVKDSVKHTQYFQHTMEDNTDSDVMHRAIKLEKNHQEDNYTSDGDSKSIPCCRQLEKSLSEKEKLLKLSNFSFTDNDFNPITAMKKDAHAAHGDNKPATAEHFEQSAVTDANVPQQNTTCSKGLKGESNRFKSETTELNTTLTDADSRAFMSCLAKIKRDPDMGENSNDTDEHNGCPENPDNKHLTFKNVLDQTKDFECALEPKTSKTVLTSSERNMNRDSPKKIADEDPSHGTDRQRIQTVIYVPGNEMKIKTDIKRETKENNDISTNSAFGIFRPSVFEILPNDITPSICSTSEIIKPPCAILCSTCDKPTKTNNSPTNTSNIVINNSLTLCTGDIDTKSTTLNSSASDNSTTKLNDNIPFTSEMNCVTPVTCVYGDIKMKASNSFTSMGDTTSKTTYSRPCTSSDITIKTYHSTISSDTKTNSIPFTSDIKTVATNLIYIKTDIETNSSPLGHDIAINANPLTGDIKTVTASSNELGSDMNTNSISLTDDVTIKTKIIPCIVNDVTVNQAIIPCTSSPSVPIETTAENDTSKLNTVDDTTTKQTSSIPCTSKPTTNETSVYKPIVSVSSITGSQTIPIINPTPPPPPPHTYQSFNSPPWAGIRSPQQRFPAYPYGMYGLPYQGGLVPYSPYTPLSPSAQHYHTNMYSPPVYDYQQGPWNYNLPFQPQWPRPYPPVSPFSPRQHAPHVSPSRPRNNNNSPTDSQANPISNDYWRNNPY